MPETDVDTGKPTGRKVFAAVYGRTIIATFDDASALLNTPLPEGGDDTVFVATASGDEVNYARFGERFAENIGNRAADIDQDGQTSLLEAFLSAAQQVRTFYTEAGRMASEHPLLDDNGDKLGVSPDWFRGTRVVKRPENSQPVDGFRARQIVLMDTAAEKALTPGQRLLRDQYEQEMEHLRAKKAALAEDEYYRQLEVILRQLAAIYVPAKKS